MTIKTRNIVLKVATLIAIVSMLAACGAPATPAPTQAPAATEAPAATTAPAKPQATEAPTAQPEAKKFTIGISNPFISSEYRTQMIAELIEVNKEYMDQEVGS